MSVSFRILPERGLVYVRYEGEARPAEGLAAMQDYARHPLARPGQRHFVDLAAVTAVEEDYARISAIQALKAELMPPSVQTMLVFYAPSAAAQAVAAPGVRAWEPFDQVVARVMGSEAAALEFIGLGGMRLDELLAEGAE